MGILVMNNTILIIDDDSNNLNLLADILDRVGYKVLFTATSHKGIKIATSQLPQLILLDILMPNLNGFEVCQRLKSEPKTQDIPIIFMTGLIEIQDKIKGFELGAVDYITKPIEAQELLARLASHLKISHLQQLLEERNGQLEAQAAKLAKNHHDLHSILNQLQVGTLITDANGHIIFVSDSCTTFEELNQNNALEQSWEDVLPLDIQSKEQLRLMMKKPAEQRTPVALSWENKAGQHYWLECDIRNDPREPTQYFFYFYDKSEVYHLRHQLSQTPYGQVGNSEALLKMYKKFVQIAQSDCTVMIEGETGVGKELVAHGIHTASSRQAGPFTVVNCGGLTESLSTSQLFGHRKGAFTGAIADQIGFFEAASGGTLFLDEIGELPLSTQSSLLRVLQENEVTRIGETKAHKINVRIVTATHKNLEQEVREGRFREDLFYRINVTRLRVPPLRERPEDIPLLVKAFLTETQILVGKTVKEISREAMDCLQKYHWPGNVRELKNAIQHGMVHSRQAIIRVDDLPPEILRAIHQKSETCSEPPPDETIEFEGYERTRLLKALEKAKGNRSRAAQLLKMSRAHFYRRLKVCDISFTESDSYKK